MVLSPKDDFFWIKHDTKHVAGVQGAADPELGEFQGMGARIFLPGRKLIPTGTLEISSLPQASG